MNPERCLRDLACASLQHRSVQNPTPTLPIMNAQAPALDPKDGLGPGRCSWAPEIDLLSRVLQPKRLPKSP
jgi:hypothetical protein